MIDVVVFMLCYVMLCYVMLCYVMLCYVMSRFCHIVTAYQVGLTLIVIPNVTSPEYVLGYPLSQTRSRCWDLNECLHRITSIMF